MSDEQWTERKLELARAIGAGVGHAIAPYLAIIATVAAVGVGLALAALLVAL